MKFLAVVFFGVMALNAAGPTSPPLVPFAPTTTTAKTVDTSKIVSDQIISALETVALKIRDANLDPYKLERFEFAYGLPVPIIFDAVVGLTNLLSTGLSNFVVHNMNYGLLTSRLTLDISMPKVELNIPEAWVHLTVMGKNFSANTENLRFAVVRPRVAGQIQVNLGIVSGISLRNAELDFSLRGLEFDGDVTIAGQDLSAQIHEFIAVTIPRQINVVSKEISELLNILISDIGNSLINNS